MSKEVIQDLTNKLICANSVNEINELESKINKLLLDNDKTGVFKNAVSWFFGVEAQKKAVSRGLKLDDPEFHLSKVNDLFELISNQDDLK